MSFAAGFFNAGSAILDENQRFIKEKRAKDRDFLMTYGVQSVTKAQEKVNNAVTVAMQLESYGVPKEEISYIVDTSGPLGLKAVYDEIKPVYDEGLLTPDNLAAMMKRTKDYKPPNMTYEDMIKKTFGLYKANATDDPAENEKIGFWSALGFDSRAADSALNEQYIDGYTGRDIKRIMGTASPGLKAPVPVDFSFLPKVHSDLTLRSFAASNKSRILVDAQSYVASKRITSAAFEALDPAERNKITKIEAAIKEKRYDLLLRDVPTIGSSLLDFDKETRGGLSNNPHFRGTGFETFFANAAANIEGDTVGGAGNIGVGTIEDNTAYKSNLNDIYIKFSNILDKIKLENIKTYKTREAATASGDPIYIHGGELRGRPKLLEELNKAAIESTETPLVGSESGADGTGDGAGIKRIETPLVDSESSADDGAGNGGPVVASSNREDKSKVIIKPQEVINFEENAPDPLVVAIAQELGVDDIFPEARVTDPLVDRPNLVVSTLKGIANSLEEPSKALAESMKGPVRQVASIIEKPVTAINESLTNYMDPLAVAIKQGRNGTSQDVSLGDIFSDWFSNTFPNFSLPENPLKTVDYAAGVVIDELKKDVPPELPTAIELIPGELPFKLLMYGALDSVKKEGRTFADKDVAKQWLYEFLEKEEDFLIKSGLANYETGEYPSEQTIDLIARTLLIGYRD